MTRTEEIAGARVSIRRRLAWAETDAAGHNHFAAALRWLEDAEHELWTRLGHADLVPRLPRVHVEIDYRQQLSFGQPFLVTLAVAGVGRSSCAFMFEVCAEEDRPAIAGQYTVVHVAASGGAAAPWPAAVRAALDPRTT